MPQICCIGKQVNILISGFWPVLEPIPVYPDHWFFQNFEITKFKTGIRTRPGTGCKTHLIQVPVKFFGLRLSSSLGVGVQPFATFHIRIVKSYFSSVQ
jgi:hypothetical protein